jgi:hypothetical protein
MSMRWENDVCWAINNDIYQRQQNMHRSPACTPGVWTQNNNKLAKSEYDKKKFGKYSISPFQIPQCKQSDEVLLFKQGIETWQILRTCNHRPIGRITLAC